MSLTIELTKKLRPFAKDRFLLAVSGGMDSMSLLHLFRHFQQHFGFQFSVVHFHHGPSQSSNQQDFRNRAFELVKQECGDHDIEFFSNVSEGGPGEFLADGSLLRNSEAEYREARHGFFENVMQKETFEWVVFAHHQEDQLETQLMRLIRGTGPDGLSGMTFTDGWRMRPLLSVSKDQLKKFLMSKSGKYIEDPSNQDFGPFRNWIRHHWLEELENRRPGSKQSLYRSLDHIVSSLDQPENLSTFFQQDFLDLSEVLTLSESEKRQVLAAYMKSQGLRNYGLSHINEVLKRLDRVEKRHTFKMLGRCWKVDAGRMSLEPLT